MTQVKITAAEIKTMANELSQVMNELEITWYSLRALDTVSAFDVHQFNFLTRNYIGVLEDQIKRVQEELDEIAAVMYNCDNELELKAIRENK